MAGVGAPELVIPSGDSPHSFNMRPSSAAALQNADLVFWIGHGLTPQLEDAIETLAGDAKAVEMLEVDGTTLLDFREGALFEAHDHEEDHDDHDDHGHEADKDDHDHDHDMAKADDHDHDDHAKQDTKHEDHDEHAHDDHDDHDDHAGHDHGEHDPHAWLSPGNASVWLNAIAAELSALDPENAGSYFANAAAAREEMAALSAEVAVVLEPARGGSFVVFHDAYQYFETYFDLPASGAISISDATDPSPARVAEIQTRIREEGIACVLAEPQFNPSLVATVMDGSAAKTRVIDPLGAELELGADLYPTLIRNMAKSLANCF
jgi:zinc transport system substrate-binding protein